MRQRLKVMIVDDDAVSLSVAVAILEDGGYDVQPRDSALGTVIAVKRDKPDVVLLDVTMPGLNGDSLTRLILDAKSEYQPIVILLSSKSAAELERLATSCNAAGYVEKSSSPRVFLAGFERIVSRVMSDRSKQDRSSTTRK